MKCWKCGEEAVGVCKFCGRALCKKHAKTSVYLITSYDDIECTKVVAVANVLFCGECKPHPKPIPMPELE